MSTSNLGIEMRKQNNEWLPLDVAAEQFGYAHKESLRRRLRQLRERGLVRDFGRPPAAYQKVEQREEVPITLMWPNPKTALLHREAPPNCWLQNGASG